MSHLENTKQEYEEELKNRYLEIQRLNKLKEMQIHSEKEKAYLAEIDALKLEVSELRAENYDLLSSNDRLKNDKINMEQQFMEQDKLDRDLKSELEERQAQSV